MSRGLRFSITASDRSRAAFSGVQNNIKKTQGLQRSWNAGLNANRRAVQQFGFQMSDFAIQVAGGQSAMLAFTQQGGQMLQFFGPAGAIAAALLAIFGSLAIAFTRSGKALSDLTPILGVLGEDFRAIGRVLNQVKELAIDFANVVLNNMDRIIITVGVLVGIMAGRWVAAFVAARIATFSLVGALTVLRGALIRTGIGAIIVGLGELVYQFTRLVRAAGGFGEAMELLGEIVKIEWNRMVAGGKWLYGQLRLVFNDIAFAFVGVVSDMREAWASFVDSVASTKVGEMMGIEGGNLDAMRDLRNSEMAALNDTLEGIMNDINDASDVWDAPNEAIVKLRDQLQKLDKTGKDIDIRDWFGGGDGDGTGKLKEQADIIKETFDDLSSSISKSLGEAFRGLLDRTKSIKDVAVDLLNSVLNKLIDTMMNPIWERIGDGITTALIGQSGGSTFSGGWLSGIFNSLFGFKSFAGGGSTGKGARQGGLDGRGGRLIMAHPNEEIYDNTRHQGPEGGMALSVHIHENATEGDPYAEQSSDGRIDVFLRKAVTEVIGEGGADRAMRNRYGLKPQPMGM